MYMYKMKKKKKKTFDCIEIKFAKEMVVGRCFSQKKNSV